MLGPDLLARVTAAALVPEQVIPYVSAVAGSRPRLVGSCVGYESDGEFVLVGYPAHDPMDVSAMVEAVHLTLAIGGLRKITVIGPARPPQAPPGAQAVEDTYYALRLPTSAPEQKLRNLLRRAGRELTLHKDRVIGKDHVSMVEKYLKARDLSPGTRSIFAHLGRYLEGSAGSLALSARLGDCRLAAFAVGEFAPLTVAFFMFCFRDAELAPPGAADLVLSGLIEEAEARGHTRMNLGLGMSEGIRFFKSKWGAEPFLPYVETSWSL